MFLTEYDYYEFYYERRYCTDIFNWQRLPDNLRKNQVVAATINRPLSRKRESASEPDSVGTKEVIRMNINDRIRHYIESNNMTFGLVAERASIDDSKFSRMMTNKQRIRVDEYERICDALCVPHSYFFQKKFLEAKNKPA